MYVCKYVYTTIHILHKSLHKQVCKQIFKHIVIKKHKTRLW